jgi:GT2 family glycosyltransferase
MNDPARTGISTVVPVKGRCAMLRRLLASLWQARQECPEPTEVIVVDDSAPGDRERNAAACREFRATMVDGPRHVGAKRNHGAAMARYDLLMFIDSDCVADDKLLRTHAEALRSAPARVAASAGPTLLTVGAEPAGLRLMRQNRTKLNEAFGWPQQHATMGWATTSNLAVRKQAFRAVGGFAEDTVTVVGGEDVDLGLRLTKAGYVIRTAPAAVAHHDWASQDTVRSTVRRLFTYGRSSAWLSSKHPERTRRLLNPVSLAAVGAASAALGGRRLRRPLAAAAALSTASLFIRHATMRYVGAETTTPLLESVFCTVADWSHNAGQFVGALQVRRPSCMFTRFRFRDRETFTSEAAAIRDHG